jgi:Domain of unknown function (DUF4263)
VSIDDFDWEAAYRQPADEEQNEVVWALGRKPDRTYANSTFRLNLKASRDHGQPARFVYKVFDEWNEDIESGSVNIEWEEEVVMTTPGGRKQLRLLVAREAGQVRELRIQRVPTSGDQTKVESILKLDRDGAMRLIELVRNLQYIPVEGDEKTVRLDDQAIRDFFADPDAAMRLYAQEPDRFRGLIELDPDAEDVVAVAHRKQVVADFRTLLEDSDAFQDVQANLGGPEKVWQTFIEDNPWILGVSLSGQLLTAWSHERLEQVVAGFSIGGPGKRTDALLRTTGRIRSLVFAEIKHHKLPLLEHVPYRSGCWAPSEHLSGGVAQIQKTVHLAVRQLGLALADTDEDGAETGESTHLVRPRSFLIVGNLEELRGKGGGGIHQEKFHSFELYRRNLYEPEIVTFDELLARAEWHVNAG